MPIQIYLKAEGIYKGQIKDNATHRDFYDYIEVLSANFGSHHSFNQATLEINGKRRYNPLHIVKFQDKASIDLFSMMVEGDVFRTFELTFTSRAGNDRLIRTSEFQPYLRLSLINACILNYAFGPATNIPENENPLRIPAIDSFDIGFGGLLYEDLLTGKMSEDNLLQEN